VRLLRGLSKLVRKSRADSELDGELRSYIDMATDQKVRDGMDPASARREAMIEFGGVEAVKEQVRDVRTFAWLDSCCQDARYALRGLRKNPGFTTIALLSLALGIGANSAIFAVFYSVVVRPLPYSDPGQLLAVGRGHPGQTGSSVFTPEFVAWQNDQHVFTDLASWNDAAFNLTGAAEPERLIAAEVSPNFLEVLKVHPVMGRDLSPAGKHEAIITYELWQRQFAADSSVIGRPILLSDTATTLVGVLPPHFRFPGDLRPDVLVPDDLPNPPNFAAARFGALHGIGRLRPGATAQAAAAALAAISQRLEPLMPDFVKQWRAGTIVRAYSLHNELVGDTGPILAALVGAVGLLLLLACLNVANLQLARAAVRRREIGLRTALGASRKRLARLLIIENLVLASIAGALGLAVASALSQLLPVSAGIPLADAIAVRVGWRLAAVSFAFSTIAGLLVGVAPALLAPRLEVSDVLKSGALSLVDGRGTRLRSFLVASEVALALVLLLGSGLLLRSLKRVLDVDLGYRTDHVLMANLRLAGPKYQEDAPKREFLRSLLANAQALPGVDSAAIVNSPPLAGGYSLGMGVFSGADERRVTGANPIGSAIVAATPDYLRVLQIRLLRGRMLNDRDRPGSPLVALVNESFVKDVFHGVDPLDKMVYGFDGPTQVVGVFADVRHSGPEGKAGAEMLVSQWQHPQHVANLVIRTRQDPAQLASAIRPAVWSVDKDLPVSTISTMDDRLAKAGSSRRIRTALLGSFGFLALLLAAVGIYGVASEAVAQRTREIGLRMALGARSADVVRSILGRSLLLSAAGIVAGAVAGIFLVRYLKSLLFGVQPTDAIAFGAAASLLFAVSFLAGYGPARRAARTDPMTALRCE
jgi:putative ABC transport system permease protein